MSTHHHSERKFEVAQVRRGDVGPAQRASKTTCCKCGVAEYVVMTGATSLPSDVVKKMFSRLGWSIDIRRDGRDVCPRCQQADVIATREKKAAKMTTTPTLVRAAPPRVMSREDRRLIFVRLNEVYESEKTGYAKGHSDKSVATELDMPATWIATVRDENFGPLRENAEIRGINEAIADLKSQHEASARVIESVRLTHEQMTAKLDDLIGRAKKLAA